MTPPTGRQLEITLLQERSAGTFAKVYLAEARGTDNLSRIVAVKVLKEQWSESTEVLDRTYDEARLLARLHHKNILRVEALTELEGQPAIIMEFVDGVDLKQLIERLARRGERIPPRTAYKIAQDTAGALEAAYFKVPYGRAEPLQVVHRDVKPSNIMLSVEGEVKVLDFGTARSNYEGRLARTGALRFGSLKYMSPERREGDRGDHTTDVYALGLVLLEMLRGESLPLLPLDANEHDEALADILANLGPLGLPNEQWEDSLRQTVAAMCASHPSHRLNASQVVQLLRAFAEQATGPLLDSFSANVVAPIAKEIYGVEHQGPLTGTRLLVSVSSVNDGPDQPRSRASLVPEPATGAPRPGASMVPGATQEPRRAPPPVEESYDDEQMPTVMQGGAAVAELRAAAAELSAQGPAPVAATPQARPSPPPPAATGGYADAGPAYGDAADDGAYAEEPEAQSPDARKRTLMLVAVAAGVGLFLVLGAAGAAIGVWWYMHREPEIAVPTTTGTPETPPETPPPVAAGDTYKVTVTGDENAMFQWIKLTDAAGTQIFKGKNGEGSVPAGTYTLTAKQAGRDALKTSVTVGGDLSLSCTADDQKQVRCTGGGLDLVLAP